MDVDLANILPEVLVKLAADRPVNAVAVEDRRAAEAVLDGKLRGEMMRYQQDRRSSGAIRYSWGWVGSMKGYSVGARGLLVPEMKRRHLIVSPPWNYLRVFISLFLGLTP